MILSNHRKKESLQRTESSFLLYTLTIHILIMKSMQHSMQTQTRSQKREYWNEIGNMMTDQTSFSHMMQSVICSQIHLWGVTDTLWVMWQVKERTGDQYQCGNDGQWLIIMSLTPVHLNSIRTKWKSSQQDIESLCLKHFLIKTDSDGELSETWSVNDFRMVHLLLITEQTSKRKINEENHNSRTSKLSVISYFKHSLRQARSTLHRWTDGLTRSLKSLMHMKKSMLILIEQERSLQRMTSKQWFEDHLTLLICLQCGAGSRLHQRRELFQLDSLILSIIILLYEKRIRNHTKGFSCMEKNHSLSEAGQTQALKLTSSLNMGSIFVPYCGTL